MVGVGCVWLLFHDSRVASYSKQGLGAFSRWEKNTVVLLLYWVQIAILKPAH